VKIIKLQKNNITNALDLVWRVFQEFEAPDYSKQGIEEFRKFISYNSIIEQFNSTKKICRNNDKNITATRTKREQRINSFYSLF